MMAGGFHSRSPEELREYLSKLHSGGGKKNARNFIVFLDIILLLVVFYMASRLMNPGGEVQLKKSEKVEWGGLELYLTRSNQKDSDIATYYIFYNNTSQEIKKFQNIEKGNLEYISETRTVCLQKPFTLEKKEVPAYSRESSTIQVLKIAKESLHEDCRNIYKTPSFPRTVYTLFDKTKKYRIDLVVKLSTTEGKELEFIIPDESW